MFKVTNLTLLIILGVIMLIASRQGDPNPKIKILAEPVLKTDISLGTCAVTQPPDPPFLAPEPNTPDAPYEDMFWYGSDELWTMLLKDGIWAGLPYHDEKDGGHYSQKVFWWRHGYVYSEEPEPTFSVRGVNLDDSTETFESPDATNAYNPVIKSAMLTGVELPSVGCWEITGYYQGHELSFVVWVER